MKKLRFFIQGLVSLSNISGYMTWDELKEARSADYGFQADIDALRDDWNNAVGNLSDD